MRPEPPTTIIPAAARGLILAAAVSLCALVAPVQADEMGWSAGGSHMQPRPRPAAAPSGSVIVPPLPPNIVPPLVQGPCCQDGFRHHRAHRFPFLGFGVLTQTYSLPPVAAQPLPAPGGVLPPPPPDFEPRVVTLKPSVARPGDPATVIVMRAGEPLEVVTFRATETR
jgi:hypothetical protein